MRKQLPTPRPLHLLIGSVTIMLAPGCGYDSHSPGAGMGSGGRASGGAIASGGSTATASGGATGSGGATASGGVTGSGGAAPTGGATGGVTGSGGVAGTAGATGGVTGAGGDSATGGGTGSGGAGGNSTGGAGFAGGAGGPPASGGVGGGAGRGGALGTGGSVAGSTGPCGLSNCPVAPHDKLTATIPWLDTAPTMDGRLDDSWLQVPAHPIARTKGNPPRPTATDFSATWRGMWDGTNLYLFVEIMDDQAKIWTGSGRRQMYDVFELYMDADFSQPPLWFAAAPKGYCWEVPRGPGPPHEGHKRTTAHTFVQNDTATGWSFEMKFPLASYQVNPVPGDFMGLEINISDADTGTGRDIGSAWNDDGDRAWASPRALGKLIFGAKTSSP